ncbi:AI-2E family transporter [Paenibacillus motobuensis]|uniref:AI-2E family transporter n=1 Tax=Paenibacillus TaxID=44249 RepID=UPI0020413C66|nr:MULTISPECIES: AI-2E family transporter [Paenibacillus]MCM3039308.1 AI-2E family transporter [Paenibacillus lutimineralis]MCM3646412.1 AI-2E family transporter [Paenibacillus motobuensis]
MDKPYYRRSLGIIMALTIIYLLSKVSFIFNPIVTLVQILIVPLTISAFLYYLLRPIVIYLEEKRMNRILSILLIYLMFAGVITVFLVVVWPPLEYQITEFINNVPKLINGLQAQMNEIRENRYFSMFNESDLSITNKLMEYANSAIQAASGYISHVFSFLNDFVIVVGTVPIMLYYMLKEDRRVRPMLVSALPTKYREDGDQVLQEIDGMLRGFIAGRMIDAVVLTVMSLIGFWIIGLPYPLMLSLVMGLFSFIPYFGTLLGAIPSVIVAFTISPAMVIWVIVVVVVSHQIEANLISPYIYGRTINIHPLTTIILLLIAGDFAGILGMLLAIPVYMMMKIIAIRAFKVYNIHKS